jgi:hypothetical protein
MIGTNLPWLGLAAYPRAWGVSLAVGTASTRQCQAVSTLRVDCAHSRIIRSDGLQWLESTRSIFPSYEDVVAGSFVTWAVSSQWTFVCNDVFKRPQLLVVIKKVRFQGFEHLVVCN